MRANEIIRGILDLIDNVEGGTRQPTLSIAIGSTPVPDTPDVMEPEDCEHDDIRRFKQIIDLASDEGELSPFSNSPNEKYAGIEAVTSDAGGGVNGPKHPADIKSNSVSMYPNFLAKGE